jgi:hypothetical protein
MGDSQPISGKCSGRRNGRSKSEAVPIFLSILFTASLSMVGQERPPEQMEVFRSVSEALANRDADAFLDQFDRQMPRYETLRDEIQELFGAVEEIGSTVDVITDVGDDQKRTMDLDWLLKIDNDTPRRQIVKCQIEKRGKKWKIVALEPVEFFRK